MTMTSGQHRTALVTVTIDEVAQADFEGFLDLIASRGFGGEVCTSDLDYEVVRAVGTRSIELLLSAFVQPDDED